MKILIILMILFFLLAIVLIYIVKFGKICKNCNNSIDKDMNRNLFCKRKSRYVDAYEKMNCHEIKM